MLAHARCWTVALGLGLLLPGRAIAQAAFEPLPLTLDPTLNESSIATNAGRPVFGRADEISGRSSRELTLRGAAELRSAGAVIRAERITFYEADEELVAVGDVRIARGGQIITGPELQYRFSTGEGTFASPRYSLPRFDGRGRAERIDFLGPDRLVLREAVYTTCEPDDPDWFLVADSLAIDEAQSMGTGRSARLVFKGVPILATPWFAFPLGDERRSGLLPPSVAINSRTGAELTVPYYWNIAPNRDLTLYPTASARRGLQLGGEYRYLESNYSGYARFELLPDDRESRDSRYLFDASHRFADIGGWSGGLTLRGVSDDRYFVDWSRNIADASQRSLPRELVAYRSFGDWTVLARMLQYQNILEARDAPPYDRLPQIVVSNTVRDLRGADFGFVGELNRFERRLPNTPGLSTAAATGWRGVLNPSISYPFRGAGWFVIPKASLHASVYELDSNSGQSNSLTRVVPTYSIDAGLVMERDLAVNGRNLIQTLEPRLFYVYTPYRDQRAFPVFDSAPTDFNFAQLFSENPFTGGDRIADVNQLTPAVVSRLIDPANGAEFLRLAVAQRLYFDEQRVTIPGVPLRTDSRSDVLLAASADVGGGLGVDAGVQWAIRDGRVPRFSMIWRYWPRANHLLNFGVRYQSREYAQVDTSWRWELGNRWNVLGRVNYSFLQKQVDPASGLVRSADPGVVESLLGLEYRACCWTARFVAQRFITAAETRTTAFFFQLELQGLARLGIDPFDIFTRSIPGYVPPVQRTAVPSRFYGYE